MAARVTMLTLALALMLALAAPSTARLAGLRRYHQIR